MATTLPQSAAPPSPLAPSPSSPDDDSCCSSSSSSWLPPCFQPCFSALTRCLASSLERAPDTGVPRVRHSYYFARHGAPLHLTVDAPADHPFPLTQLSPKELSSLLLRHASLSPDEYRVTSITLAQYGPVIPFSQAHKLRPSTRDDPHLFTVAHYLDQPTPTACVVDVDLDDLLAYPLSCPPPSPKAPTPADATPTALSQQLPETSRVPALPSLLTAGLVESGYFRIRLPASSPFAELIRLTTSTALSFFALPTADKRACRSNFEYSKFVGYATDGARQFMQMRTCKQPLPWPTAATAEAIPVEAAFTALFLVLAAISRIALQVLCETPELQIDYAKDVQPTLEQLPEGDPRALLRLLLEQQPWQGQEKQSQQPSAGSSLVWGAERTAQFVAAKARRAGDASAPDRTEERAAGAEPAATVQPSTGRAIKSDVADDAAGGDGDRYSVGSDVFRVYQYFRARGTAAPKIAKAATGTHVDMGLLTCSPEANVPGLTVLHPDASRWVDVESGDTHTTPYPPPTSSIYLHVFSGECLSLLTGGRVRAAVHYVEERVGVPRISMPFFLRPNPHSRCAGVEVRAFLEGVAFPRRATLSMSERSSAVKGGKGGAGTKQGKGEVRETGKAGDDVEGRVCKWSDY